MRLNPPRVASGFTLIEIMVAVTIIGLLAAIAIPVFTQLKERTVRTLMTNEFRVASAALGNYAFEKGEWPPDGAGGWPAELAGYLPPPDRWNDPTPLGGKWAWARDTDDLVASLRINDFTAPLHQLEGLDRMTDDGQLATGSLRVVGTSLVYVLE